VYHLDGSFPVHDDNLEWAMADKVAPEAMEDLVLAMRRHLEGF